MPLLTISGVISPSTSSGGRTREGRMMKVVIEAANSTMVATIDAWIASSVKACLALVTINCARAGFWAAMFCAATRSAYRKR